MEILGSVLGIVYTIAGYWATGKTIYANKVVIYSGNSFFIQRLVLGFIFGWILIPVAVVRMIIGK